MGQSALTPQEVYGVNTVNVQEFDQCRYDGSRLLLRGPRRDLDGAFVACLGGTDTFARFIREPYPDLLESTLGITCVNFGLPNAGIDVFRNDPALLDCASRARVCVLQVPNAINMTNIYYRVHPRRNDRVLEATAAMRALFPKVEFARFNFTRHMLNLLRKKYPQGFSYLQRELISVWTAGMIDLLGRIDTPVVLLWLSTRRPEDHNDRPELSADPALVSRPMLDALKPHCAALVEVLVAPDGRGLEPDKIDAPKPTAEAMLTPKAHAETAVHLGPTVSRLFDI